MSPLFRFILVTLIALGFQAGSVLAESDEPVLKKQLKPDDDDAFYGTEHRFNLTVPSSFAIYLRTNCSGTYEGIGEFGGDRRFAPYRRHYSIVIKDDGGKDEDTSDTHRVTISWKSFTTADAVNKTKISYDPQGGLDTIDNIDYSVKDSYFDGTTLWGNTTYQTTKGATAVKMPFLAACGQQVGGDKKPIEGILLLGRYEGPVFLKKVK